MSDFFMLLEQFARGGGGGSGGGGGGGGGSGGGGGGGGIVLLLFFIGYFPSYYLGKLIKKLLPRNPELIVSASIASLASIVLLVVGWFIGIIGELAMIVIIAGIWTGWIAAFFSLWEQLKKQAAKTKQAIAVAGQNDSAWNEEKLLAQAKSAFMQYQADWSTGNGQSMHSYMIPSYATHAALMLSALAELGRRNQMDNVTIQNALIIDAQDHTDNSQDSFTVAFEAKADDRLIDIASNTELFKDSRSFTEYWTFNRSGDNWLLGRIDQSTADIRSSNNALATFARNNHMYYSLDMGWLFLPKSGVLFKKGKFGTSDVNNHVIGTYSGHLVQFYTFVANPSDDAPENYLVVQLQLPKSYGGIIIERDKNLWQRMSSGRPGNYQKYEFEWPDFNKRYDVYATNADRLATFELLNPGFMAYLYDTDSNASIEVADNTVYLYKKVSGSQEQDYRLFLTIMLKAFKELKL
ncbi:MAG TPA: TIM44-like domain-containing protein [Candidatus Saccharimonadales bacterium]